MMNISSAMASGMGDRRQRIHELVLALIAQRSGLELLDHDTTAHQAAAQENPAGWLERNRRILQQYQAIVRTAVTLDALVDQDVSAEQHRSSKHL